MNRARLRVLRHAVRTDPDTRWTTVRVQRLYRAEGVAAPLRATARKDLAQLAREGLLTLDDTHPDERAWLARTTKAVAHG